MLWLRFSRSIYIGFASNYTHKYNLLDQQRRGDRIGTTAAAHILHFGVQNRLDLLDGHLQAHGHIVVAPLEQHLALKVDQFVFARANQQTDQFVVDVIVDLCGNVDKGFNKKKKWNSLVVVSCSLTLNSSPNGINFMVGSSLSMG